MQQTIEPTLEVATQASARAQRISDRAIHLLSFVPDDKLTWIPSSTAKSSLRVIAHCALTNRFFASIITGTMPEKMPTPEEFFAGLSEAELRVTTREAAVSLMRETTAELCKALESVNSSNIDADQASPFGPLPMSFWVPITADHMAGHVGQLEYLQTIWGDLDNHFAP